VNRSGQTTDAHVLERTNVGAPMPAINDFRAAIGVLVKGRARYPTPLHRVCPGRGFVAPPSAAGLSVWFFDQQIVNCNVALVFVAPAPPPASSSEPFRRGEAVHPVVRASARTLHPAEDTFDPGAAVCCSLSLGADANGRGVRCARGPQQPDFMPSRALALRSIPAFVIPLLTTDFLAPGVAAVAERPDVLQGAAARIRIFRVCLPRSARRVIAAGQVVPGPGVLWGQDPSPVLSVF